MIFEGGTLLKYMSIKRKPNVCGAQGHTTLVGLVWHCWVLNSWNMAPHTTLSFGFLLTQEGGGGYHALIKQLTVLISQH